MSESTDKSPPNADRRKGWYWADSFGTGMLATFLAFIISLPIAVAGARLTEGNWESSTLFGVCYYGFVAAIATTIFRRTSGKPPPRRYKLRWWVIALILVPLAAFVSGVLLLDSWTQRLQ